MKRHLPVIIFDIPLERELFAAAYGERLSI